MKKIVRFIRNLCYLLCGVLNHHRKPTDNFPPV